MNTYDCREAEDDFGSKDSWEVDLKNIGPEDKIKRIHVLENALREQRELWELVEPCLNDMDHRKFQVLFMELHDPKGCIDKALKGDSRAKIN